MPDGTASSWAVPISVDRSRLEAGLESLVARNRFTIAVVVPIVGGISLLGGVSGVIPESLAFDPYVLIAGVLIMRLPLIAGIGPLLDRKASALLLALCAYAYAIEFVGIQTGWPYGEFGYQIELGPMIQGVPIGLPVFFLPLVMNAYLLAILLLGSHSASRYLRLPATVGIVLAVDLVLDPGAVAVGFWSYFEGGAYYGVPISNFLGWLLSGTIGVLAFDFAFDRPSLLDRLDTVPFMLDDLVSFLLLWGLINLAFGNWLAVGVAVGLAGGLIRTDRFDFSVIEGRLRPPT